MTAVRNAKNAIREGIRSRQTEAKSDKGISMLKIDRTQKNFSALNEKPLPDAGLTERADLQQMILNSSKTFFDEMGESLLLIGDEVQPVDYVDDRIDLLALDKDGAGVVIELKRGANKLQLLQALSYTAMVSNWDFTRFIQERTRLTDNPEESTEEEIERFILEDIDAVNSVQRIILIAEDFDYSVLITAEWLSETYDLDIRCYRIALSTDGTAEYLTCTCIYPPRELTEHAIKRGRRALGARPAKWKNWDEAISAVDNQSLVDFLKSELESGRENNLGRKRYLAYRINGKRRWFVTVREKNAYVWQVGRFDGDIEFWKSRLDRSADPVGVKDGKSLRFYLTTTNDFNAFLAASTKELAEAAFRSSYEPI